MANDLNFLANRLVKYGELIQRNAIVLQKEVAQQVLHNVVSDTPADTGRAISNWLVGSGESPNDVLGDAHVPGKYASTRSENEAIALTEGVDAIARHKQGPLHIANNLDYIQDLNDGKSTQAPKHFVEAAVLSAVKNIEPKLLNSDLSVRVL